MAGVATDPSRWPPHRSSGRSAGTFGGSRATMAVRMLATLGVTRAQIPGAGLSTRTSELNARGNQIIDNVT